MNHTAQTALGAIVGLCAVGISIPATAAWEPVRPVEFIVPAGTGGGADQMARTIQGIVTKHNLMKQPMVVINKSGGAGGEGFLDLKTSGGNPHKIIITLSNLFTTPLATGIPFNWKGSHSGVDAGAGRVRALGERRAAVQDRRKTMSMRWKAAPSGHHQDGRHRLEAGKTRSSRSRSKRQPAPSFTYIPYKGGGEVAVQLVGNHVDSTVQQSDRGGRAMARRQAASALRVRRAADGV